MLKHFNEFNYKKTNTDWLNTLIYRWQEQHDRLEGYSIKMVMLKPIAIRAYMYMLTHKSLQYDKMVQSQKIPHKSKKYIKGKMINNSKVRIYYSDYTLEPCGQWSIYYHLRCQHTHCGWLCWRREIIRRTTICYMATTYTSILCTHF